jgi:D-beta-D-heptose 7-phosphate kinase/D-beta-D-heptose 1-phosphate adenosyltransferase
VSPLDVSDFLRRCRGEVVGVVGDVMLDRFVWGRVSRISPEAPVPVVEVEREEHHLGGAANVARNLSSLGARVLLLGVVGEDEAGRLLRGALAERGLSDETLLDDRSRRTTVKTRILAQGQQVVRADWESTHDLEGEVESRAREALKSVVPRSKALVLSDYSKGTLTPALIAEAIELARRNGVPVLVDPKLRRYRLYRRVALLTPNTSEAERFTGLAIHSEGDLEDAARAILRELECAAVLITRGEQGMSLFERGRSPVHIPTAAREVFDVSGAGDTVVGTAALALATGLSLPLAAELANRAAGIVVGKLGTATVLPEELEQSRAGS